MTEHACMDEVLLDRVADALAGTGCLILDQALPPAILQSLHAQITALHPQDYRTAGIGRDADSQRNARIRNDEIRWLETSDPVARDYLDCMESLRTGLNQRLFLGLFDYESHYAHYAPGAYYKRHLDAFHGETNRIVTTVLYLNPDWPAGAGGELVIYEPEGDAVLQKVEPQFGRLVIFLSEKFPHEVLPASRDRYSIAGWFRINSSSSQRINPA